MNINGSSVFVSGRQIRRTFATKMMDRHPRSIVPAFSGKELDEKINKENIELRKTRIETIDVTTKEKPKKVGTSTVFATE